MADVRKHKIGLAKARLFRGGAIAALTMGAVLSLPAYAQDRAGIEEIVVTAQKREESLQTVPISITAMSNKTSGRRID